MRLGFSLFVFLFISIWQSAWAEPNALLWRMDKTGQPTSYLMGTMHVGHEKLPDIVNLAKKSMIEVETLCLELIMDEQVQQRLSQRMLYTGDLKALLGPERVQLVSSNFLGSPLEQHWYRFKPWVLVMLILMPEEAGLGVDQLLQNEARDTNKALCALETVDEQINIFDGLSLNDQLLMLDETLSMLAELPAMLKLVTDAYIEQDLTRLWNTNKEMMLLGDEDLNQSLMDRFLDSRNLLMVERADKILLEGSTMVAVGALHLPGPKGLLQLFRSKGYKVSPVFLP